MPDEPDPPRKHYGFKERVFQRDNAPAAGLPPQPTARDLALIATQARRPAAPPPAATRPADPNDVFAVLEQNRTVAQKHGADRIEIRETKSRRSRDFWLILVGGNLTVIGVVWFLGLNPVTVIFGLAGLIIFSLGLSWIMWQVMDRY